MIWTVLRPDGPERLSGGCLIMIVLLLDGPENRSGGGGGGFATLEEMPGQSSAAGAGGGACLKSGAGLKEGRECDEVGKDVVWRLGCGWNFGCSMNTRGCTRAIGDFERCSSSVVMEQVEKFVMMGSR